jgi:hypothetical protein
LNIPEGVIDALNPERNVSSGQDMPAPETQLSVPNDAADDDLDEEVVEQIKEAIGLTDIPPSTEGGELLNFQGVPRPRGLQRDEDDDDVGHFRKKVNLFGDEAVLPDEIPPKNESRFDAEEEQKEKGNAFLEFLFENSDKFATNSFTKREKPRALGEKKLTRGAKQFGESIMSDKLKKLDKHLTRLFKEAQLLDQTSQFPSQQVINEIWKVIGGGLLVRIMTNIKGTLLPVHQLVDWYKTSYFDRGYSVPQYDLQTAIIDTWGDYFVGTRLNSDGTPMGARPLKQASDVASKITNILIRHQPTQEQNAGGTPQDKFKEGPHGGVTKPVASPEAAPATSVSMPTIRQGSKGDAVVTLQQRLMQLKYLEGLRADGDFDFEVDSAVRKFQKDSGLTEDGIVGPNTWGKLGYQGAPARAPAGESRERTPGTPAEEEEWDTGREEFTGREWDDLGEEAPTEEAEIGVDGKIRGFKVDDIPEPKRSRMIEVLGSEEAFLEWFKNSGGRFKGREPVEVDGRYVSVIDFGEEFPVDVRYDGVKQADDGSWYVEPLARKEIRALKLRKDDRLQRREMRREKRPVTKEREEKRRQRLRRREELRGARGDREERREIRERYRDERKKRRRAHRMIDLNELHKVAKAK